jgi:phosphatidylglycerol:prolipoprotein diacylglycerol transferase
MRQILFEIPLHSLLPFLPNLPVYGWGAMLFLALVACVTLACWLARRQGIAREIIQDMAVWLVVGGLVGARLTFIVQYPDNFTSPLQFFAVWDGGMVSFGAFVGGVAGFILAYRFLLRKNGVRFWQMADLIMPCLALGFAIGRIGCLLNGCCYGGVACPDCPAISFPYSAAPRLTMTERGYQSAAGFTLKYRKDAEGRVSDVSCIVDEVDPGSAADRAGLRPGDTIVKVNGQEVHQYRAARIQKGTHWERAETPGLADLLTEEWHRGVNELQLTVRRAATGELADVDFTPWTIGLHPTQLYESVSMVLLMLVLLAYLPLRRQEGELVALFSLGYAAQRFLDEMLRSDTPRVWLNLTWGQLGSVALAAAGIGLWVWLWRRRGAARPPAGTFSREPQASASEALA